MIGSVRGTVLERTPAGEALVEVGGVGYRVHVPVGAVAALVTGSPAFLFTHLHVRDDAFVLYGFPTREERDTFAILIATNGVGPKLALAVLGVHSPASLRRAVAEHDVGALTLVPGVGARTAARLLVELESRLGSVVVDVTGTSGGGARAEAREALTALGYSSDEVRDVLGRIPDDATVEDLLRDALRLLAASR
jgi:Holliday junction DNA helicase RuvA